jgi:DNA-binding response OmpR family regulator
MNKSIKILLVDDDLKNSMLLRRFLEADGFEVTYANNGAVGWELYQSTTPDLILMDVNMPEMNGFELAAKIRQVDSRVMIFFLTDRTEKNDRLLGFKVKGNDYIPKPFYPEELIAKVHERFDSVVASYDEVFQLGNTLFCPSTTSLTYAGETHNLSVRQSEILRMFAKNVGKMVDRDAILQQVWGDDSYANSLALNVQITYLRRQLTDPSIQIVSIKKRGYILSITV